MSNTRAYAVENATTPLKPWSFDRREVGPKDVKIDILYCGVCHSDIHQARNEWGNSIFPMVPGHEIVGKVTQAGSEVTKFSVGDLAGVGVIVSSCGECHNCKVEKQQQFCERGAVETYNGRFPDGTVTYGGYSENIVVDEAYTLKVSPKLSLAAVAPLLCAGITTYSPLRHWNVQPGQKVGVVGLGGLGHMALKFAHSFGAHVTQFTTSPGKEDDARRLGADEVVLSRDAEAMKALASKFDFIIDTVSAAHDLNVYLGLLRLNGTLVTVGVPPVPAAIEPFSLLVNRRSLAGSGVGGIEETQEMLDYCAEHNIVSDIEMISIDQVNDAYERVIKSDVKYRFVIDMASLKG
jgi:uncharacterized zinc-type alcohol dehydrogenase-like protein